MEKRVPFRGARASAGHQGGGGVKKSLFLVCVFALSACGGGGGGGDTPTESRDVIQVAGTWQGTWSTSGQDAAAVMTLSQSGSSLRGTVSVLNSMFDIRGNSSGTGMAWSVLRGGCDFLSGAGSAASSVPAELIGSMSLDNRSCPGKASLEGPIRWVRGTRNQLQSR